MTETDIMMVAMVSGLALGLLFFGGLWFMARKAKTSKTSIFWLLGSWLFRIGIVLSGFYWLIQRANWLEALISLAGFTVARLMVLRLSKAPLLKAAEPILP